MTPDRAAFARFAGAVSQSIAQDVRRVMVIPAQPWSRGGCAAGCLPWVPPMGARGDTWPPGHPPAGPAAPNPADFTPNPARRAWLLTLLFPVSLVALLSPLLVVWVKFGALLGRGLGPAPAGWPRGGDSAPGVPQERPGETEARLGLWLRVPPHLAGRVCPGARPACSPSFPGSLALPDVRRMFAAGSRPARGEWRRRARGPTAWLALPPALPLCGVPPCPSFPRLRPSAAILGGHSTSHTPGHPAPPVPAVLIRGAAVVGEGGTLCVPPKPPGVGTQPPCPAGGVWGSQCCRAGAQLGASVGCSSCLLRSGAFYKTEGNKIEEEKKKLYYKKIKKKQSHRCLQEQ